MPAAYGRLARLVNDYRQRVKQRFANPDKRRYFWESVLQGRVAELLFAGQEDKAREPFDGVDPVQAELLSSLCRVVTAAAVERVGCGIRLGPA